VSYPLNPGPPHPYGHYGQVHTQVVTQPYRSSTAHLVVAWVVTALTVGYTLPWAIAATRNKTNTAVIAVINILLGWSLIGWIVTLVMSLTSEPHPAIYVNTAVVPGQPPYGQPAAHAPSLPPPALPTRTQPSAQLPPPPYGYHQPQPPYPQQSAEPTTILPPYGSEDWQRPPSSSDYR
jgi:hypothetical protein